MSSEPGTSDLTPLQLNLLQYVHLEKLYGHFPRMTVHTSAMVLRRLTADLTDATWVWLTPPPVDEARADQFPPFKQGGSVWRNADVQAISAFIRRQPEVVVDLQHVFGVPITPGLQGPDGVHPSRSGQQAIARAVVGRLTR